MVSIDDNNALLIYKVGPVYCCAPSYYVDAIIQPPHLTHPPGTDQAQPGIFKYGDHIVSVVDLRHRFGVEQDKWAQPGRLIVTNLNEGSFGFWVDKILDVVTMPSKGWGNLPPHLPRGVFSKTLLLNEHIHLYSDFHKLNNIQQTGYLKQYIEHLEKQVQAKTQEQEAKRKSVTAIPQSAKPELTLEKEPNSNADNDNPDQNIKNKDMASLTTITQGTSAHKKNETVNSKEKLHNEKNVTHETGNVHKDIIKSSISSKNVTHNVTSEIKPHEHKVKTANRLNTQTTQANKKHIATGKENAVLGKTSATTSRPTTNLEKEGNNLNTQTPAHPQKQDASQTAITPNQNYSLPHIDKDLLSPSSTTAYEPNTHEHEDSQTWLGIVLILLLGLIIGGGSYYLLMDTEPTKLSRVKTTFKPPSSTTLETGSNESSKPANDEKTFDVPLSSKNESALLSEQELIEPSTQQQDLTTAPEDNTDNTSPYHASIQKDEQGITIILNPPIEIALKKSPHH